MHLLPTTVIGSYPQPSTLVDPATLAASGVPRVPQPSFWRLRDADLSAAMDAAARDAIADMERAGVDVVTDGEVRRQSYSVTFAAALSGVDTSSPAQVPGRSPGTTVDVPRITGPLRRPSPVLLEAARFLRAATTRPIKVTVPGPFTLSQQCVDEHYGDPRALAMAFAECVGAEVRDLFDAGVDVVQLDEPWMQARPEGARAHAIAAIDHALSAAPAGAATAVHLCFGYAARVPTGKPNRYAFLRELDDCAAGQVSIEAAQPRLDLADLRLLPSKTVALGVLDLADPAAETPQAVAARIRDALRVVPPERLILAPDCGMKYLPRDIAYAKLESLAQGAAIVRQELQINEDATP